METLFESGGLAAERSIDVPTAYTYPDIDTAIRAQMSSGPARRAIEHAGAQPLRDALTAALIDHHGSDKSIRLDNVFRVLIARA